MAVLMVSLAVTACAPHRFALVVEDPGAALTAKSAEALAASTDISALANVPAADAPAMRTRTLAELRSKGADGARAADDLTAGFPAKTAAVPVLVRFCSVDGTPAIVVVEAFGQTGGDLTHRRLWVFDRATGTVIRAASFR